MNLRGKIPLNSEGSTGMAEASLAHTPNGDSAVSVPTLSGSAKRLVGKVDSVGSTRLTI